jgi:hypothetical protein
MSLGVIVGFTTAYPLNVWMVSQQLKHGLMTQRKPGSRFDLKPAGQNEAMSNAMSGHANHGNGVAKSDQQKMQPAGHPMHSSVTTPQLAAVTTISILFLLTGLITPANWINLRLSAREVGGLIMPPGMITSRNTSVEKMQEMAAVHPRLVAREYGIDSNGDVPLEFRIESGVKIFNLEVSVIRWHILPNVAVDAFAYNA